MVPIAGSKHVAHQAQKEMAHLDLYARTSPVEDPVRCTRGAEASESNHQILHLHNCTQTMSCRIEGLIARSEATHRFDMHTTSTNTHLNDRRLATSTSWEQALQLLLSLLADA